MLIGSSSCGGTVLPLLFLSFSAALTAIGSITDKEAFSSRNKNTASAQSYSDNKKGNQSSVGEEVENQDEEEEGQSIYSLFVCEEYITKNWSFDSLQQQLLCSNMSSTDHDLTGQIVWPACVLLSWFIHSNRDTLFSGKHLLELGAGCGLAGFVAANYCRSVLITDGNDIVVRLLDRNWHFLRHLQDRVAVAKLLWGDVNEINKAISIDHSKSNIAYTEAKTSVIAGVSVTTSTDTDSATAKSAAAATAAAAASSDYTDGEVPRCLQRYPDVVIGADVVLWPNQVIGLLFTIRCLLHRRGRAEAQCYISYIVRAHSTTKLLLQTAMEMGLRVDSIPIESFVPSDCRDFDELEKQLLKFTIDHSTPEERLLDTNSAEIERYHEAMQVSNMPC